MDNSSVGYLSGELWNSPAPGPHTPLTGRQPRAHDAAVHLQDCTEKVFVFSCCSC